MEELKCAIWFASLTIKPIKKYLLWKKYGEFSKIYHAPKEEFLSIENFDLLDLHEIEVSKNQVYIEKYLDYIHQNDIQVISINDERYPAKLKEIYDPPVILFAKGNLALLSKKALAIVGSRLADDYGRKVAYDIAKEISANDICIVSGMALGIDAMSHLGAIRRSGNTIAVLGTGIDIVYPKDNENLYREIVRNGLVLSELIIGTKPNAQNFPMRNRIISGLSDGVLVVEAKEKSGALITVDFALDQGKTIYAIPGAIDNELSLGCNLLIQDGATIVMKPENILEDFGIHK